MNSNFTAQDIVTMVDTMIYIMVVVGVYMLISTIADLYRMNRDDPGTHRITGFSIIVRIIISTLCTSIYFLMDSLQQTVFPDNSDYNSNLTNYLSSANSSGTTTQFMAVLSLSLHALWGLGFVALINALMIWYGASRGEQGKTFFKGAVFAVAAVAATNFTAVLTLVGYTPASISSSFSAISVALAK